MLIAVIITEMVILHKYVCIIFKFLQFAPHSHTSTVSLNLPGCVTAKRVEVAKCRLTNADDPLPAVEKTTTCVLDNPNKASGPVHIPTRILIECCAELSGPLCRLFHLCFSCGVFPNQWKLASVTPVHKRDSKADPPHVSTHLSTLHHQQSHGSSCQQATSGVSTS